MKNLIEICLGIVFGVIISGWTVAAYYQEKLNNVPIDVYQTYQTICDPYKDNPKVICTPIVVPEIKVKPRR